MGIGWFVYFYLQLLWMLGALVAYRAEWLTPSQMLRHTKKGLPFLGNSGIVNDVLFFHAGCAMIVAICWPFWRTEPGLLLVSFAIGIIGAFALQTFWSRMSIFSEAQTTTVGGLPSLVGIAHIMQMIPIIAILVRTLIGCFESSGESWMLIVSMILLCIGHLNLGDHWLIAWERPSWAPDQLPFTTNTEAFMRHMISVISLWLGLQWLWSQIP